VDKTKIILNSNSKKVPRDIILCGDNLDAGVEVVCKGIGYVRLKDVLGDVWIYSVSTKELADREFLPPKSLIRIGGKNLGSSFKKSMSDKRRSFARNVSSISRGIDNRSTKTSKYEITRNC